MLAGATSALEEEPFNQVLQPPEAQQSGHPPNVVLILADDLGFSDIAPYGSEINTPNLSALAASGVSFTNYHTAANCAPARAMLLTGVDAHLAGVPNIPEMLAPEQRRHAHYRGVLGQNVVTVATLLEDAGYHTYMAGKWHLGSTPGLLPSQRGFERTVALADSGADNWEQRPYIPLYDKARRYADGAPYQLPEDFYSSRFLVDKTIEFIDGNLGDERPFFAYLPFQAVHIPVQAPQAFIDPYMAKYHEGWDIIRDRRRRQAAALGVIPSDVEMVGMQTTADWQALDADQQRYEAKRMAVYAGMVEAMDYHIGRLITYLKSQNQFDNTVFIFTSDNGAEASGPADPRAFFLRIATGRLADRGRQRYNTRARFSVRRLQPPRVLCDLIKSVRRAARRRRRQIRRQPAQGLRYRGVHAALDLHQLAVARLRDHAGLRAGRVDGAREHVGLRVRRN